MKFAYFSLGAILAALVLGASLSVPASAATDLHASAVQRLHHRQRLPAGRFRRRS